MTRLAAISLTARSILWTLLLPGMVAGWVPWRYVGVGGVAFNARDPLHWLGLIMAVLGALTLGACIVEFARSGKGTLSPLDAPPLLVARGLYRYVRNPMYVGVTTVLAGELLVVRSIAMFRYVTGWLILVNIFVLAWEEPTLRRMFGEQYLEYKKAVPRWIPRTRPWPD